MRIKLVLFFCFISITAFAQNGITFEVEELSKPEIWLSTRSCDDIYKELILSDVKLWLFFGKKEKKKFLFYIITKKKG